MRHEISRHLCGLLAAGLLCSLVFSAGCVSVGRDADGNAIIGFAAGVSPDRDDSQAIGGAVGAVTTAATGNPVVGAAAATLTTGVLGLLGLGGAGTVAVRNAKKASDERARAERSEGRHSGWEERELAAASVRLPSP